jgi:transposase, IS5 family
MPDAQPAPMGGSLPRGHLLALNRSFRRTLEAENKSPRTVEAYTDAVRFLALYCEAHGKPLLARQLRREHIQDFIADQLDRWKPATAHNRYRSLHAFFKWAVAGGDLQASRPPSTVVGDRGFGTAANDQALEALGVTRVGLQRNGTPGKARQACERTRAFRRLRNWRVGIEARISHLKRSFGLRRTRLRRLGGARTWVGLGIFAYNLQRMTVVAG